MTFWKNKTVLVTGAAGFTGSHLCREILKSGARVRAFVEKDVPQENIADMRGQVSVCYGDVTDLESLLKNLEGVDYVFNPAAIVPVMDVRRSPQKGFLVNGIGSFNVAYASIKSGVKRMLHVSTCHVYGNQPGSELPIRENTSPLPGDLYAASKYAAEIYLKPLVDEGFPLIFSRAFALYGPSQGIQYLIPRIITQLLKKQVPKLGSPKPTRDYSYITDIARGYMLLLEKGEPGEIYHLSSEKETSVREIYQLIARLIGVRTEPVWNDETRPQDIMRLFGDSGRARKQFGWKPEVSLEEGLSLTIDWWRKQMEVNPQ